MELFNILLDYCVEHWLPLTAAAINILWVTLEYRASMWLWPVGIILPIFYIIVSWEASFIGNIAINIYYLITSIIGWIMWLRGRGDAQEKPITLASSRAILISLGVIAGLYYPIYLLLAPYSSLAWADTLATVTSLVGMIYLSKKWLQHWYLWMVANLLSLLVFYTAGDYISTAVFGINFGMSILGLSHWTKLYRAQRALGITEQEATTIQ